MYNTTCGKGCKIKYNKLYIYKMHSTTCTRGLHKSQIQFCSFIQINILDLQYNMHHWCTLTQVQSHVQNTFRFRMCWSVLYLL